MDLENLSGQNSSNSFGKGGQQTFAVSHVLAILFSATLIVSVANKTLFSYHPIFMSLGYVLFMTEGVIAGIQFRQLEGKERVKAISQHMVWQISAVSCILIAFTLIYYNKMLMGKPHFSSLHGKFGLATVIFSIAAPLLGAFGFRTLGLLQKFSEKTQIVIKKTHRYMGATVWMVALLTIELALPHKAVFKGWLTHIWQVLIVVLGLTIIIYLFKKPYKKDGEDGELVMKAV